MGRWVAAGAAHRDAAVAVGLVSLLMAGPGPPRQRVAAAWLPLTRYPPGAVVGPMLPVMVTGAVLMGAGRLAWESLTLRRVSLRGRVLIAGLPLLAAVVALAWPLGIRAVLGL